MLVPAAKEEPLFPLAASPLSPNSHPGPPLPTPLLYPGTPFVSASLQPASAFPCTIKAQDHIVVRNNPLAFTDPSGMFLEAVPNDPGDDGSGNGDPGCIAFCFSTGLYPGGGIGGQYYFTPPGKTGGGGGGGGKTEPVPTVSTPGPQQLNPPNTEPPAPNNGEPPSACLIANINAVNAVSKLNVNPSNVVGQPFIFNGGLDVNFSVPGASPSQLAPGRYASSLLTKILGVGQSLHVPSPGGADPSTYGIDPATGNFTFTTHIDTAYSTWHTPIGAIIHYFVDVRDKGAHRGPC
jgi:hypothetical protein